MKNRDKEQIANKFSLQTQTFLMSFDAKEKRQFPKPFLFHHDKIKKTDFFFVST